MMAIEEREEKKRIVKLEGFLRQYRKLKGTLEILEADLQKFDSSEIPDNIKFVSSPTISPVSPCLTNKISRLIEDAAIKSADLKRDKIINIKQSIKFVKYEIRRIEGLIAILSDQEKFIIEKFYFAGLPWYIICQNYSEEFRTGLTPRALKERKKSALAAMLKAFYFNDV